MNKHIHIIGICGVATSALAIAFHKKGWKVTGSDKGFYPPVSTHLSEAGVEYYAGWHPEKMGTPDIVMIGGSGKSSVNPEMLYAEEKNIPIYSYPEIIEKYFLRKNTIVCAGTWGKTTTSILLSYILEQAELDPTYMFGGISLSQKDAAKLTDGDWSVLEGDEYTGSQTDNVAKFFHYHPTHLLLTSVSWDHADVYPTEQLYFDAFEKLIKEIPEDGIIVACTDDEGVQKIIDGRKIVSYGKKSADFIYHSISHTRTGLTFGIRYDDEEFKIETSILGRFNVENITAAFAMAYTIGIPPEIITSAIKKFQGIKRRLERRLEGDVTVLDCHAPTPEKAASVLESIREVFDIKIIAVYEPNIGGRQRASAYMYDDAFKNVDLLVIPRLTKLKVDADSSDHPLEGAELTEVIKKTQPNTIYLEDDEKLISYLKENAKKGDVIAFLGSHGFRGMIEETVTSLRQLSQ
jgi:UDP-N-acetylmuramate: L-alanyl-gamma-D-glutamyl-meso-diaminopimelate ligase